MALEKDLIPLMDGIEKKVAYKILQEENPDKYFKYGFEEPNRIGKAKEKINGYLNQGFEEPNEILRQFQKYAFLI